MNERIIVEIAAEGADSGTLHDLLLAIKACDIDKILKVSIVFNRPEAPGVDVTNDVGHMLKFL